MTGLADPATDPQRFLTDLFRIAVSTADPMRIIGRHLPPAPKGRLIVIGAGKASARMAEAVEAHYKGQVPELSGLVITRYGYARPCKTIEIVEAGHPVPDRAGQDATERMLNLVTGLGPDDLVIALISGGGSALLCAPANGLTLQDKIAVNQALLSSGAPIGQMNLLRKHLSRVKGGQLAAACYPARVLSLLISDVPGDDAGMIASGPTIGDASTAKDALAVLENHAVPVPLAVREALDAPSSVRAPNDPKLSLTETRIIAAPSQSLDAAAKAATAMGCDVRILGDALEGEARSLGASQASLALSLVQTNTRPLLLLSGGECTVIRRGSGIGGPNAEFVLAAALKLNGHKAIHVLSCDTDGVDGADEIAGAVAGPTTLAKAMALGLDPELALNDNDSHRFFAAVKGQVITGPNLTNVNDFRAILILKTEN